MSDLLLRPETAADAAALDLLVERAFGPGRFTKVSERLREGNAPLIGVSMLAEQDGVVIGCARMWPVLAGGERLAFLGPLAVDAEQRKSGLGGRLVTTACEAARAAGFPAVLLVGDPPFFRPLGFEAEPARGLTLPGPVDQRRVMLWGPGLKGVTGEVRVP